MKNYLQNTSTLKRDFTFLGAYFAVSELQSLMAICSTFHEFIYRETNKPLFHHVLE
jgi:hypothetical protein